MTKKRHQSARVLQKSLEQAQAERDRERDARIAVEKQEAEKRHRAALQWFIDAVDGAGRVGVLPTVVCVGASTDGKGNVVQIMLPFGYLQQAANAARILLRKVEGAP